jgi:carboxylesterase type B
MSHLLLTLFACLAFAQQDNPFNVLSGATLFTGPASPIIDLGYASYRGKDDSLTRTSNYLGMKYANAPRYDHATVFDGPVASSSGQPTDASDYGQSCAQQEVVSLAAPSDAGRSAALGFLESTPFLAKVLKQGEDCLSINVQRPRNQSLRDLPVRVVM